MDSVDQSGSGEATTEVENYQRRGAIQDLTKKLLRRQNPGLTEDDLNDQFFIRTAIFTKHSLGEILVKLQKERDTIKNYNDALTIAKFYWDNPKLVIPQEIINASEAMQVEPITDAKRLIFIDRNSSTTEYTDVNCSGEDVYLKSLPSKEDFTLKGAEHILMAASVTPFDQTADDRSISISCTGDIRILPAASLVGGKDHTGRKNCKIFLEADNIIQDRGSRLDQVDSTKPPKQI